MSAFRFGVVSIVILMLALGGAVPALAQNKEETKQKIFLSVAIALVKKIIKASSD